MELISGEGSIFLKALVLNSKTYSHTDIPAWSVDTQKLTDDFVSQINQNFANNRKWLDVLTLFFFNHFDEKLVASNIF